LINNARSAVLSTFFCPTGRIIDRILPESVKRSNGVVETVETVETVKNAAAALSTLKRKNYRLNFSVF
jgi:ABC-type bacteriocin/lantibiotic exporter with double-glycine peptidase domain